MVLEFLLIRRDKEADGKIRDTFSTKVERFKSKELSDRRLLMAKEYSKVGSIDFMPESTFTGFPSIADLVKVQHASVIIGEVSNATVCSKGFEFFRVTD